MVSTVHAYGDAEAHDTGRRGYGRGAARCTVEHHFILYHTSSLHWVVQNGCSKLYQNPDSAAESRSSARRPLWHTYPGTVASDHVGDDSGHLAAVGASRTSA